MPDIDERLTMEAFYDTMDPQQREAFRQHVTEVVSQRFGEAVGSADPEEVHRMREVYGEQVDEPEFWMQIALNAAFWDILKEDLTRQEVALLEKVRAQRAGTPLVCRAAVALPLAQALLVGSTAMAGARPCRRSAPAGSLTAASRRDACSRRRCRRRS